ncbi:hypothetical protein F2P56_036697 [Juglans regia]|uniref:Uncharacterized protein n=1 Tax=Juglans regia TaxID=51240 RepID=A0A833WCX4_JUGRE|nr:hypothetical protein F2P56_036697 [Juglans regia]
MWKAINNALSVDNKLKSVGIPIVSKCDYCLQDGYEDLNHVLAACEFAKKGLAAVQMSLGDVEGSSWYQLINSWFTNASRNSEMGQSILNTADQLQILSNGKYKSNVHRAVVNSKATRISLGIANGPSLETIIRPAPELESKEQAATYIGMKCKDYMELQQGNQLDGKSCLDRVRAFN